MTYCNLHNAAAGHAANILVCLQLACLVKTVLASVLKLPEVSRNIKLALVELQEVDYTLKNIHAKIKFLPGHVTQDTCLHAYTSELQALREAELQQASQH